MARSQEYLKLPGDHKVSTPFSRVAAQIYRRWRYARYVVTSPDDRTTPIYRDSSDRISVYVTGVRGDSFQLEMCIEPVFTGGELDTSIDESASLWMPIGSIVSIPNSPSQPNTLAQTVEDMGYALRVVRVGGSGDFTVRCWWLV